MNYGRKKDFEQTHITNLFINDTNLNKTHSKYACKSVNSLEEIALWRKGKILSNQKIRPLQFTFEKTNRCNCNCKDCGMSANSIVDGKTKQSWEEIKQIIDSLYKFGIPSYAITGGEPFLEFDNICKMIDYSRGKVDVIKIISNGFWGANVEKYFKRLERAGLFLNRFFIPSMQISIGEQDVKMEYVCNIIHYVTTHYDLDKLHLGIINTRFYGQKTSKLSRLYKKYLELYGEFPQKRVYLTDSYYVNSNILAKDKLKVKKDSASELVLQCDNQFKEEIGFYISPKIFMKCNGDCYPCEIFCLHKNMYIGNFFEDGIEKVLENYNNNKYINFIYKYGTKAFNDVLPKQLLNKKFETSCYACAYCIKMCDKYKLIN